MQFRVDEAVWELYSEARIAAIVVVGVDNRRNDDACRKLLESAAESVAATFEGMDVATHPAVAPWRDAYRAFGAKPSRQRSSIESLIRSAVSGRLRSVNPLVDIYNAASLTALLPHGAEDLAAVRGDIMLRRATGDEPFIPLGASEHEPPALGEVIYADDIGAICRAWNWREADRTKITADTTDAFLCIEALPPVTHDRLVEVAEHLAAQVTTSLGGTATVVLVDRDNAAVTF